MKKILMAVLFLVTGVVAGCVMPQRDDNQGLITVTQLTEPVWIRNGEPVSFESEDWFPTDEVENLLENEVFQIGMYRDMPLFVERADVRPFERLYTRFSRNRYRAFQQ